MAPGHELWDGTIAFAAGCPWKAAAFLGQRRWSQTILKITKEFLWPSFFQNAVTKNVVVGKEQLQINAAAWPWSAEESTRAPAQNFIDADARNTRKMAKKIKKVLDSWGIIQYNQSCCSGQVTPDAKREGLGPVVQLVRTLACHARGRQFEPDPGRHMLL